MADTGAIKKIEKESLKDFLDYAPETGIITAKLNSAVDQRGRTLSGRAPGHITKKGYLTIEINGKKHLAHRIAWLLHHGVWPKSQLDHRNRDKLDNRIANLREANNSINARNRGVAENNKTNICGVSWHERDQLWKAQIGSNNKKVSLGYHKSLLDAAAVRKSAEIKYGYG